MGWKRYSVVATFKNDTIYRNRASRDPFVIGFLNNLYLRPSCHECRFGGIRSWADISLADFWGVQNIYPQLDNDTGVSLVLVHTTKGKKMIAGLGEKVYLESVDLEKIVAFNPCIVKPIPITNKRREFFNSLFINGYPYSKKKFLKSPSLVKRILKKLRW